MKLLQLLRAHLLPVLIGLGVLAVLAFQLAAYYRGQADASGAVLTKQELKRVQAQLSVLARQQASGRRTADSLKLAIKGLDPKITTARAATGRAIRTYHELPPPAAAADADTYEYLRHYRPGPDAGR